MKQNIILIVILIGLFVFGLLIYDFSDALMRWLPVKRLILVMK